MPILGSKIHLQFLHRQEGTQAIRMALLQMAGDNKVIMDNSGWLSHRSGRLLFGSD